MSEIFLIQQISSGLSVMTPAEKKVARAILSDYPTAGLLPIAKLAALSHVSGPTVLRFVKCLDFDGYLDFQHSLLEELSYRQSHRPNLYEHRNTGVKDQSLIQFFAQSYQDELAASLTKLPGPEFEHAVRLISNTKSRVSCTGGRVTHFFANYLSLRLRELRAGITLSETAYAWRNEHALDLSGKDTVVVIDVRAYQKDTADFANEANKNGAKIILITDPCLSPIASMATCVLPVEVASPATFDSAINIMALAELLVAGVADVLGDEVQSRGKKLQELRLASGRGDKVPN